MHKEFKNMDRLEKDFKENKKSLGKEMNVDGEISAMTSISRAFEGLNAEQRGRVLDWANNLYRHDANQSKRSDSSNSQKESMTVQVSDLASLFEKVGHPSKEKEKALIAGYFHQKVKGEESFRTKRIHDDLKELGYPISNISVAFSGIKNSNLVLQTGKVGVHKLYRLTEKGIKAVEAMMNSPKEEE